MILSAPVFMVSHQMTLVLDSASLTQKCENGGTDTQPEGQSLTTPPSLIQKESKDLRDRAMGWSQVDQGY